MLKQLRTKLLADRDGMFALVERVLREFVPLYWRRYAIAVAWMALAAACLALSAYLIGTATNQAYVDRNFAGIATISGAFLVLFTVKGLASYAQAVTMARISNDITAANQRRLFDKILKQDVPFFAARHSSEFTARLTYSANAVSNVLNMVISSFGRDVLTLVGLLSVMIVQNPVLSLIGIAVMAPSVLIVRQLVRRVRHIALTGFAGGAAFLETLQETVQGMRVVKTLGLEELMRQRAHEDIASVQRAANKLARVVNRSTPLMETLGGIAIALVLLYGGYRVVVVNVPPGEFVSFITAFLLAYEPGKRLARLNVDLSNATVGVKILYDLLDLPDRPGSVGRPALKVSRGRVTFKQVDFEYRNDEPVLRGLTFTAEPGQVTALVGPSGGGKSTIFNTLLRLYEAKAGEIAIDGQNIASVSEPSLREQIAYVGQDIFLFRGTVRQNIAFGHIGASEEDVVAAARAAHAHEFISQFPAGYDTSVGEHGLRLSGGQRQRIAVARALIRNAPIILLDEPTASLDGESERHVQDAIARLSKGRTTLVIAHRLYTIMHSDMIYMIEDGAVVEAGRHESLLRAGQRYAEFFNAQFGAAPASERRLAAAGSHG